MSGLNFCSGGISQGVCSNATLDSTTCSSKLSGLSPDFCYNSYAYQAATNRITLLELTNNVLT